MALLKALALVEDIFGTRVDPPSVSRIGQRWTPEEDQLLQLTLSPQEDGEANDRREGLLSRTIEAVDLRVKDIKKREAAGELKTATEFLTVEESDLCSQWRRLKAPRESMHWLQGDQVAEQAWEPAPGDLHLIVVGHDSVDRKFRPLQLGAAQVDLAASAIMKGVEIALMSDRTTWHEHLRKGVNRTLAHFGRKAPRNTYRAPEQLKTARALILGPGGFTPEHLDRLPAQLGVIAVTVAPTDVDVKVTHPARRVTRFSVGRLNESRMTLPVTWQNLEHIPQEGTVSTFMPDVAIRCVDAYVRRHHRLPDIDDATLTALLAPQDPKTIVGQLMLHFQARLKRHIEAYGTRPEQKSSDLIIRLSPPPDEKTARWLDERAKQRTRMNHLNAKGGQLDDDF